MKHITTVLCLLIVAVVGWHLGIKEQEKSFGYYRPTISAATLPTISPSMLPLDLQLDLGKKTNQPDTVYLPSDTVFVETPGIVVNLQRNRSFARSRVASKRLGYSIPAANPDTLVKIKADTVREEHTVDTISLPKRSIILVVDGEEVYKR